MSYRVHRTGVLHIVVDTHAELDHLREVIGHQPDWTPNLDTPALTGAPIYVGTCPCKDIR